MIDYGRIPSRKVLDAQYGSGVFIAKDELSYLLDIVDEYESLLDDVRRLPSASLMALIAKSAQ